MVNSKILATGSYIPEKVYTNDYLSTIVDTSDEWITERTGIKERRIVSENELTSDLACKACEDAIKNAGINLEEIDAIILATTTPDMTLPSTSAIVQKKLGIKNNCFCFCKILHDFYNRINKCRIKLLKWLIKQEQGSIAHKSANK